MSDAPSSPVPTAAADADTASLQWHDGWLLGYGPMDQLHHEFVTLVAHVQRCAEAALPEAMQALATHLHTHFREEEAWMQDTQFPAAQCHADEHAAVLASVGQVQERLAQGDTELCRRLARELASWFPGHADYMDAALAHWMCKQRLGGKPVVLRRHLPADAAPLDAPVTPT